MRFYGVIDPEAPYGDYTRTFVLLRNIPRGLLGLLFDQKFGLLSYSPIYLLALPGVWFIMRRAESRYLGAVLVLVTAAYVGQQRGSICGGWLERARAFSFRFCHVLRR
jgi:hypothetical protein